MTKDEKKTGTSQQDLTQILKWRLSKAPVLEDVTVMLNKGIISKEEARQLLFNVEDDSPSSEKEKALKEQIKFLEGIVEKLSNSHNWGWIQTYTYTPSFPIKYWYTSGGAIGKGTTGIYAVNSANNSVSLSSTVTGGSSGTTLKLT